MTKIVGKKKSPLPPPGKMQLSIEEARDLLLPYAEHAEHVLPHAEHAQLRWKTFDTFHPGERGIPSDGSSLTLFIQRLSR
jgi:hypothetical protein